MLGRFSRVARPAPSLQVQPDEPVVASYGPTKTATLTVPLHLAAVRYEGADGVVEALRKGARRGVLGDGGPADDLEPRQLRDDLVAELGRLAAVEADALQPRRAQEGGEMRGE